MCPSRKADQQQVTHLPSSSCHSAQQIVAISFYLCIRTLSKLQVSEAPQVTLCTRVSCTDTLSQVNIKEWEANFSGKLYSIRLMSCKAILDLCSRGNTDITPGNFAFMVSLAVQSTPRAQKRMCLFPFFGMSEVPPHHTYYRAKPCVFAVRTIHFFNVN